MRRAGADEEVLGKDWGRVQPQGSQPTFLSHPRGGKLYILVSFFLLPNHQQKIVFYSFQDIEDPSKILIIQIQCIEDEY